jgi:hypothetical protein
MKFVWSIKKLTRRDKIHWARCESRNTTRKFMKLRILWYTHGWQYNSFEHVKQTNCYWKTRREGRGMSVGGEERMETDLT